METSCAVVKPRHTCARRSFWTMPSTQRNNAPAEPTAPKSNSPIPSTHKLHDPRFCLQAPRLMANHGRDKASEGEFNGNPELYENKFLIIPRPQLPRLQTELFGDFSVWERTLTRAHKKAMQSAQQFNMEVLLCSFPWPACKTSKAQ